jgi:hypothetical protein
MIPTLVGGELGAGDPVCAWDSMAAHMAMAGQTQFLVTMKSSHICFDTGTQPEKTA